LARNAVILSAPCPIAVTAIEIGDSLRKIREAEEGIATRDAGQAKPKFELLDRLRPQFKLADPTIDYSRIANIRTQFFAKSPPAKSLSPGDNPTLAAFMCTHKTPAAGRLPA
jgi:hypothetical protein